MLYYNNEPEAGPTFSKHRLVRSSDHLLVDMAPRTELSLHFNTYNADIYEYLNIGNTS